MIRHKLKSLIVLIATLSATVVFAAADTQVVTNRVLIKESTANGGTFFATLMAPDLSASYSLTLPVDDGTTGHVLSTNGSGVLSWVNSLPSLNISGASGAGFIDLNEQGVDPATPATGHIRLFGFGTGTLGVVDENGLHYLLDSSPLTADRTFAFPDESGTFVLEDNAATLTNKTLTAATLDGYVDVNEETAPGTPSAGKVRVYAKTDKQLYKKDSTGAESPLAGGGAGEISVVDNPSDANAGWVASGAGVTVATSTTSTDLPLAGVVDTAIKVTPVSGTDYARYRWTHPASLKQRKLKVEWHQRPLSGYASGDFKVEVYKHSDVGTCTYSGGSFTEYALSTDSSGTSSIPNQSGKFTTTFDADDADCYELRIVRTAGTTALNLASVIVGPGIQPQGAVVGEWVSYTPTIVGNGSKGITASGKYRRVGDSMEIAAYLDGDTVASGGGGTTITFSMPSGFTIDVAKLNASFGGSGNYVGTATHLGILAANQYDNSIQVFAPSSSTFAFIKPASGTSSYTTADLNTTNNVDFEAFVTVPVSQWTGSGTLNVAQNDVEYAHNSGTWDTDNTTSFAYGPAGQLMGGALTAGRLKRVRFQTSIQAGDIISLECSENRTTWYPCVNGRVNGSQIVSGLSSTGTPDTSAGAYFRPVSASTTDIEAFFYRYQQIANDDTPIVDWPSTNGYWRMKKAAGGQSVGFGIETATGAGLLSPNQPAYFSGGSASLPSMAFAGDQDTGLYSFGANQIGFTAGGVGGMSYDGADLNLTRVTGNPSVFLRRAATSLTSPAVVSNGDLVGELAFAGYTGAAYARTASITSEVDGTPGTGDMPGRMLFKTTPDGTASAVTAMSISNAGAVVVGPVAGTVQSSVEGKLKIDTNGTSTTGLVMSTNNQTGTSGTMLEVFSEGTTTATNAADFKDSNGNSRLKVNSAGGVVIGAAANGTGLYRTALGVSTTTCTQQCLSDDTAYGFDTDSGTCLAAWSDSTAAIITCADATNIAKRCLCAGAL